jgi:hypothetical protein
VGAEKAHHMVKVQINKLKPELMEKAEAVEDHNLDQEEMV